MNAKNYSNERIIAPGDCNAAEGHVRLSITKLFWVGGMMTTALVGGALTISASAVALFIIATTTSLCLGHSLGMHRRLIHQSFQCPLWLEYFLVHLGVLVGLAGPMGMIRTHDMRDWAQRQRQCHGYFGHQQPMLKDAYWQLFCDMDLDRPPEIQVEERIAGNPVYRWMERSWMWQQLPWAILFYLLGGLPWVIWGICVRVTVSILGHWLIGYFAHNDGQRSWHIDGAAIQGYNVRFAAWLTMGESWHNNHHAFPGSAKIGLEKGQADPGWWVLLGLRHLGLAWDLVLPEHLPARPELHICPPTPAARIRRSPGRCWAGRSPVSPSR